MDTDGTDVTLLTSGDGRRDRLMDWSPDGTKIVFESATPAATPYAARNIYMMALDFNAAPAAALTADTMPPRTMAAPGFLFPTAIASLIVLALMNRIQR